MRQWHWISTAVRLIGMLLFAFTGITLNHASQIEPKPTVSVATARVPQDLLTGLRATARQGKQPLPQAAQAWLVHGRASIRWRLRSDHRRAGRSVGIWAARTARGAGRSRNRRGPCPSRLAAPRSCSRVKLHLDLSSIAKGFAVDRVAACASRLGLTYYLVEIGGELRGHGVKPDGAPWWIALEQPAHDLPDTILALHDITVAASGDQQRFIERDGRRLAHILDPRNGHPVRNGTASVTVIHRVCMLADAWATALMVPEPGAALALASCDATRPDGTNR